MQFISPVAGNFLHLSFEQRAVSLGFVADLGPVVVDGRYGVMQEFGYLVAVGHTESYECVDAQLRGERTFFLGLYLLSLLQKGVEVLDKGREQVQECLVKPVVEVLQLLIDKLRGFEMLLQFVALLEANSLAAVLRYESSLPIYSRHWSIYRPM